jgi:hypothetical protein
MAHRLLIEKGTVVRITQSCSVIIEQQRDEP